MERITFTNTKPNTTIKVDNQEIAVNKYVLAFSSKYFENHFFDDHHPVAENIELPESTTVEDFKRMLAFLPPDERRLDGRPHLADHFAMDNVLTLCRQFLPFKSNKLKLFKFRMAHKYGWNRMKILIVSSAYFDRYFLDNRYPKAENIELPPSTTVEDFKRMVATLPPENRKLDDDCVEAVIILADRFFVDNVTELCRDFLNSPSSNKPKLFKFRMAHKYEWNEMKDEILVSLHLDDLGGANFLANAMEFGLLDDEAKAAFSSRHADLISLRQIADVQRSSSMN